MSEVRAYTFAVSANVLSATPRRMTTAFFETERRCSECGEPFWARAHARYCSASCRSRAWRSKRAGARGVALADLCAEVLSRRAQGRASHSKILPRLLRRVAADLRLLGWDPIELLLSRPDEPAAAEDSAPGGVETDVVPRRRWLHPPAKEAEILNTLIPKREREGLATNWHKARLALLERVLAERAP